MLLSTQSLSKLKIQRIRLTLFPFCLEVYPEDGGKLCSKDPLIIKAIADNLYNLDSRCTRRILLAMLSDIGEDPRAAFCPKSVIRGGFLTWEIERGEPLRAGLEVAGLAFSDEEICCQPDAA
jgi:hypothetical protein